MRIDLFICDVCGKEFRENCLFPLVLYVNGKDRPGVEACPDCVVRADESVRKLERPVREA